MLKLRKCFSIILALVLFISSWAINTSAKTITVYKIKGTNVNVRKDAGTQYESLGKLSNVEVEYIDKKTNDKNETWYKISYSNITGYVRSDYISIEEYAADDSFESTLELFPESYHEGLTMLHAQYPNWKFKADKIKLTFSEAVALEDQKNRKQVDGSYLSLRSMGKGAFDWNTNKYVSSNGGWYAASTEIISYYMDPRNFLDSTGIIMFMQQGYDSKTQTKAGVKTIIKDTFLEDDYNDDGGNYLDDIMYAAKEAKVSPYVLASMIIQEQGTKGESPLISGKYSGYKGYYNFFNINATGSTTTEVIKNGLSHAKEKGWNTIRKSILGGAKFYAEGYISDGQDTFFYKNYNILDPDNIWHQYSQAVHDSHSSAKNSAEVYTSNKNGALSFRIPVYESIPSKVAKKPASSKKQNNYYFTSIKAGSTLTPSFDMYTYKYTLDISGNTTIGVKVPSGASYTGKTLYSLSKGSNKITLSVESETGYTKKYVITVTSSGDYILKVALNGSFKEEVSYKLGDANGDNKISIADLAAVQMHLLKVKAISSELQTVADINKDKKISLADLAAIQMHLLGVKTIGD